MRILLVVPEENKPKRAEMYPSGALILLGTILKNKGHTVSLIHMTTDRVSTLSLREEISRGTPDLIGITMNTYQTRSAKEIARCAKSIDRNILVVAGGPHPSAVKGDLFLDCPEIDVAVSEEGEEPMAAIAEGKDPKDIPGVFGHGWTGKKAPHVRDLDRNPLPDLGLVRHFAAFTGMPPALHRPSFQILGSRGCPYRCVFCNKSVYGTIVRYRSPDHVIEEIVWLHRTYGVREIYFQDDTFNLRREWMESILEKIISRGLNKNIVFKAEFRANEKMVDPQMLAMAKKANFWLIIYGVESGNNDMLRTINKGITVGETERAFRLTHEAGLKTIASLMIGNLGETRKTVLDTLGLLRRLKPYYAGFSIASPFPGTEFRTRLIDKGHLFDTGYDRFDAHYCTVRTDAMSRREIVLWWFIGNLFIIFLNLVRPGTMRMMFRDILRKINELRGKYLSGGRHRS